MPPKQQSSTNNSNIETLFIPGQQLSLEADNLSHLVRNCGARLNRLKLARASPDAPIWWQFLSSPDGSTESLDRTATELQHVLRELEYSTSELKRLCSAPASDVAGNVQREMEKKKWAITTMDRWSAVLKGAASDRAGTGREKKLQKREELKNQKKLLEEQEQQKNNSHTLASSSSSPFGETLAEGSSDEKLSKVEGAYPLEMTARRNEAIQNALSAMDRIESLRDELETTESKCNAALKLSQKFRDIEVLETRFGNVQTRRRQFQEQVHEHLSEIGKEIEKEAKMRIQNAREYYEEHHSKNNKKQQKKKTNSDDIATQHSDPNHNNNSHSHHHGDCERCITWRTEIERLENLKKAKWVDRAVRILCTQAEMEKERSSSSAAGAAVPTHRILALIGSDKDTKQATVVRPLFSRRITKPSVKSTAPASSGRDAYSSSMTFDLPASLVLPKSRRESKIDLSNKMVDAEREKKREEEEAKRRSQSEQKMFQIATSTGSAPGAEWKVPSAHDHTKSWRVRLSV